MPLFYIHHRTHYQYTDWVVDSANQIKLYPLHDQHQQVLEHRLEISHQPDIFELPDYFQNKSGFFSVIKPHQSLSIESFIRVEMSKQPQPTLQSAAAVWSYLAGEEVKIQFHDYLRAEMTHYQTEIESATVISRHIHPLEELLRLSDYIYNTFEYKKGVTTIETDIDELWKLRAGVCQDFAHLLLYMMRLQDIPCRYVSGYICPGTSEWRGEGATHAWVEAWLPDVGWVGIDPTNKCMAGERHVRLAVGRSFTDCTPVKGTYKGSLEHLLEVSVQFSTQPFTDEELKLKPFTPEQQMRFNKGVFETYDAYLQRQQQQQ